MTSPFGTEPLGGLSPEELLLALEAAHAGTFRVDLRTHELRWSASLSALHGLSPDEAPRTFEEFLDLVHPDDRGRLEEGVRAAVDDGVPYSNEIRAVWPDGSIPWPHGAGGGVGAARGRPAPGGASTTPRAARPRWSASPATSTPSARPRPPATRCARWSTPCTRRRRLASPSSTPTCATCASTTRWLRSPARRSRSTSGGGSATCCRRRSVRSSRSAYARRARADTSSPRMTSPRTSGSTATASP